MVFDLIVSALVTVLVVMLTDGILTFFGNGLMNIGYRSAWIFGENAAAVNHHNVILIFKNCHVLADFIHTAKADNPQAACRLRCFRSA